MYKLLIVEDEELVRRGIRAFVPFEQLGIAEIFEAENGEEGLRLFEAHSPDLALLDINMPRMNGLDLARKIKETRPQVKIAVITGYDYFDYVVAALKLGIDDYVMKPVSRKDVSEVLVKLVNKLKNDGVQAEVYEVLGTYREKTAFTDEEGMKGMIVQFVEQNIGNPNFSLSQVANEAKFSVGHMSGVFKRLFGTPFQEYVISLRLDRAKLLVLSTDKKMYEISVEVGFDNPNYFSAAFKKKFGVSPLQYRERLNS